ncbi:hypothetical protein ABZ357_05805 [Streptomyces sp. NPDC005917]
MTVPLAVFRVMAVNARFLFTLTLPVQSGLGYGALHPARSVG